MTRKNPSRRASVSLGASALFCAASLSAVAQELPRTPQSVPSGVVRSAHMPGTRTSTVKPAAKRAVSRRLVKIRTRAGDTLPLLGDRFGASAEEIAVLNGLSLGAVLRPGSELLIPLPSPEMLLKARDEKLAQSNNGNLADAGGNATPEDAWENVQGVLFRRGSGVTRKSESAGGRATGDDEREIERDATSGRTLSRVVEASDAKRRSSSQPVWIFLVG